MNFKILFDSLLSVRMGDFDDKQARGYANAVVFVENNYYEVIFYSHEGIIAEMNNAFVAAEPGMIIIPELTFENMEKAVDILYKRSMFFDELKQWPVAKYKDYKEADLST